MAQPEGCVDAMQATFSLSEAINGNRLTIKDLTEVCRLAIGDGHDMILINLGMMATAVELSKSRR